MVLLRTLNFVIFVNLASYEMLGCTPIPSNTRSTRSVFSQSSWSPYFVQKINFHLVEKKIDLQEYFFNKGNNE